MPSAYTYIRFCLYTLYKARITRLYFLKIDKRGFKMTLFTNGTQAVLVFVKHAMRMLDMCY